MLIIEVDLRLWRVESQLKTAASKQIDNCAATRMAIRLIIYTEGGIYYRHTINGLDP